MNNTTTYSSQHISNTINSNTLFNQKFNKPTYRRPRTSIYNPFTHKARSLKAQSLLEAILALLQYEAKTVGMEKEAIQLTHNILKRNYIQRRS